MKRLLQIIVVALLPVFAVAQGPWQAVSVNTNTYQYAPTNSLGYGWDDLRTPVTSIKVAGLNAPGWESFTNNFYALAFSGTKTEDAWLTWQMPHTWATGSLVYAHLHTSMGGTAATNGTVWVAEYMWANMDEIFPLPASLTLTNLPSGNLYQHDHTTWPMISGSGKESSSIIMLYLYRDHDHPADTNPNDCFLLEVDLHYQISKPGGESGSGIH